MVWLRAHFDLVNHKEDDILDTCGSQYSKSS